MKGAGCRGEGVQEMVTHKADCILPHTVVLNDGDMV